jgi:hypothetical protein
MTLLIGLAVVWLASGIGCWLYLSRRESDEPSMPEMWSLRLISAVMLFPFLLIAIPYLLSSWPLMLLSETRRDSTAGTAVWVLHALLITLAAVGLGEEWTSAALLGISVLVLSCGARPPTSPRGRYLNEWMVPVSFNQLGCPTAGKSCVSGSG